MRLLPRLPSACLCARMVQLSLCSVLLLRIPSCGLRDVVCDGSPFWRPHVQRGGDGVLLPSQVGSLRRPVSSPCCWPPMPSPPPSGSLCPPLGKAPTPHSSSHPSFFSPIFLSFYSSTPSLSPGCSKSSNLWRGFLCCIICVFSFTVIHTLRVGPCPTRWRAFLHFHHLSFPCSWFSMGWLCRAHPLSLPHRPHPRCRTPCLLTKPHSARCAALTGKSPALPSWASSWGCVFECAPLLCVALAVGGLAH